jgi:Small subunit of serine palmitoyltransferase-like
VSSLPSAILLAVPIHPFLKSILCIFLLSPDDTMPFTASPPIRRKQSLFSTFMGKIELMYYQYEVTFSPYVLTPGEKLVLNTIVVVLLTLLFVGMATYLPKLVARAAVRLFCLYAGAEDKLSVNSTAIWHEINAARVYER